jgi:hypothetical protein
MAGKKGIRGACAAPKDGPNLGQRTGLDKADMTAEQAPAREERRKPYFDV